MKPEDRDRAEGAELVRAQEIAATYPPGPAPMTTTAKVSMAFSLDGRNVSVLEFSNPR